MWNQYIEYHRLEFVLLMILNAYAVLDLFLTVLRLPLGLLVVGLSVSVWRGTIRRTSPEDRTRWENRCYLLVLLALLLLGLNVVAWPLLYALLQSYVPQWPGVMCIYGVTRIGTGSQGPSRYLPALLATLQTTKPAVVFLSGAWFVLYRVSRRTESSRLSNPLLLALAAFGLLSTMDAILEGAYLMIPKNETFLDAGCCTATLDSGTRAGRLLPEVLTGPSGQRWLTWAFFGFNCLIGAVLGTLQQARYRPTRAQWLPLVTAMTVLSIPLNWLFLVEVAAPLILHLPYHHCPYDLLIQAPENMLGVATFLLGCFSVGWAGMVQHWGTTAGVTNVAQESVDRLLFLASFGYLGLLVHFSVELAFV